MKTSKALNIILSCLLLLGLGISCVQDDEYDTPTISCDEPDIAVNATIADVKALYNGSLMQISDDLVIEGYVVSNDEAGNFYRTLHFQDALENPTEGFQLDVDLQDMYATYQLGRKIYLSVQGLYLDNYKGVLKLGGIYENSSGDLSIGRLSAEQAASRLFRACEGPQTVSPAATSIDMISDQMINTLIQLDNVEVAPESLCQNYALEGENTNIVLKDCNGNEIILRNSGYSTFYKDLLPLGSGSVVAVLGKYGSDFQLTIRDTNDVSMSNPRCDGSTFTCEAPEPTVSIQDIKNLYEGSLVQITGDMVFDATVTANDISGNLYKYIYVQDETAGIKVKINQKDLYLRGYEVGQQITVNAADLYLGDYGGEIQLGGLYNGNIGNIDEEAVYKHLFLGEANAPLDATVITMDAITADQVGMFVQLADVQFSDENEIFASSSASATNRSLVDCNANSIVVRTSKYADFAGNTLPAGNGPIFGILNVYNGTYQLLLRDANDVAGMTNTKCDIYAGAVQKTLAELRGMFTGQSMTIEENIKITAVITSDMTAANIYPTNAFAQDATAGIALRFDDDHSLELGNEVSIALLGVALEEYNGLLQLNNIPLGNITATATGTLPTPTAISLAEALTGNYESMLVSIADVQFKTASGDYSGSNVLTDCTDELTMYVRSQASFSAETISDMNGVITGVMSEYNSPQLYLRNQNDIAFTNTYVDCSGGGGGGGSTPNIYFSEYAEGSSNNKYLEIYNASDQTVDLSNFAFPSTSNAPSTPGEHEYWNTFDAGATIAPGDVYIIAHSSADPSIVAQADQTHNYLSNGDDGYALAYGTEADHVIVDRIGDFQADPGSGWSVAGVNNATKDHTLVRKASVTQGNPDWTASAGTSEADSEWIVKDKDDWTGLGTR